MTTNNTLSALADMMRAIAGRVDRHDASKAVAIDAQTAYGMAAALWQPYSSVEVIGPMPVGIKAAYRARRMNELTNAEKVTSARLSEAMKMLGEIAGHKQPIGFLATFPPRAEPAPMPDRLRGLADLLAPTAPGNGNRTPKKRGGSSPTFVPSLDAKMYHDWQASGSSIRQFAANTLRPEKEVRRAIWRHKKNANREK